jgi:hypothetical protein
MRINLKSLNFTKLADETISPYNTISPYETIIEEEKQLQPRKHNNLYEANEVSSAQFLDDSCKLT